MGGGVGLSVHGKYRIATEKTLFAMPETAIGLFPDVGGSWFLPRLPGQMGMYLGLTGDRLKGKDVVASGVATHFVPQERFDMMVDRLLEVGPNNSFADIFAEFGADEGEFGDVTLDQHRDKIDHIFGAGSVEEIIALLEEDGSDWAKKQLKAFNTFSPLSTKVTFEQIRRGETAALDECFNMEYRICQHMMDGSDFYEGVRALLVDKDNNPKWMHSTYEEISNDQVLHYFQELPADQELNVKQAAKA
eukprot:GFYU01031985.1.p1 GENE.GFYU01031985.1~~GFYU01031985.1.p1  ORF type:complete len:247 (-),score=92.97 GFYU01031985.1:69-809(-)